MSINTHQVYRNKAIVLAKTMVIKFEETALLINEHLLELGYEVDKSRPETWKYYLNLFGEYHQYDRDKLLELSGGEFDQIRIKVAGDNRPMEVDFNKDLLQGDTGDLAIANEYRFNTQYYNELITRYPDFHEVIKGILNPIPTSISLDAYNGEILYIGGYIKTILDTGMTHFIRQDYGPIPDNFLIEVEEENLIFQVQDDINSFLGRWYTANYNQIENLVFPTMLGLLYVNIPTFILNGRLYNAKSPLGFTHTYHIREYLDSNGNLGWVTDYIKKDVLLWLYRNLMWLDANVGKEMVFKSIVDNVLSPSNVPLSGHRLRHDITFMEDGIMLVPKPYMERDIINFKHTGSGEDYREVLDIIKEEKTLAVENYYDQQGQADVVSNVSKYSMFDNVNTKVLESTVIDMSSHMGITLEDIALNLWLFTASHGFYRGTVIVTNPVTNERVQLTPLNAYILAIYCLNVGWSQWTMEEIPEMYARLIARSKTYTPGPDFKTKPTLEDMEWGTVKDGITTEEILDVMGDFEPTFNYGSAAVFNREMTKHHAEAMRQWFAFVKIEDRNGRAYGEHVHHKQWWYDVPCKLTNARTTKYKEWLLIHGIELEGFERFDYITLGLSLIEAATGVDLNRVEKLRNKQSAVLAILKHFSSYTIQIIQNTASADSYQTGNKTLRVSNIQAKGEAEMRVPINDFVAKDNWAIDEGIINLANSDFGRWYRIKDRYSEVIRVDIAKQSASLPLEESGPIRVGISRMTVIAADIPKIDENCFIRTEIEDIIVRTEVDDIGVKPEKCDDE